MDELEIDRAALAESFQAEAAELLEVLDQGLLGLEKAPDDAEQLNALFRAAHTLKGGAAMVGLDGVRDLAHEVENLFERLRARSLRATPESITLLLGGVDGLRRAIAEAQSGQQGPSVATRALQARLAATRDQVARPGSVETSHPTVPEERPGPVRHTLRVDVGRLDRMLNLSGEIAIARGRLADMLERAGFDGAETLLTAHRDTDRLYLDLQELIMKARMVPIGPTFRKHLRTVRDLASATGKQARLVVEGEEVEVDTAVVEQVRDPLAHLVRNAVDHGIEPTEVRRASGKDPCGTVKLHAWHEAGTIVIRVEDDGGGLDLGRIAARAEAMGLVAKGTKLEPEEAVRLVLEPGFSTAAAITEISGRGVGMDVARRNVEALRGSLAIESRRGEGTAVTLRLPLTLAIIPGFRVAVGEESYIVPLDSVVECLELVSGDLDRGRATGVIELRGQPLPFLRLRHQFRLPGDPPRRENVVVVRHGQSRVGLAVDRLLGETQTVIKPLGRIFHGVPGVAGSCILSDGRVALILDVAGLLRETLHPAGHTPRRTE